MDVERFLAATAGYERATRRRTSADRPNRLALIDPSYNPDRYGDGQNPQVVFDGEAEPTRRRWPVVGAYWPHPGDRVVMMPIGRGDWVILGPTMSEAGAGLHTPGPAVSGNMVTGSVRFTGPDDFTSVSAGRMAEGPIEFGPLAGNGPVRVMATPESASSVQITAYAHSITESGATIRLIDTFSPTNSLGRTVQWMAVRGLG
ncbi:hypothetical protein ACWFMI_23480 [Nocardiopsis terrae]|uniref:hypothetical protein n=1 Tax=Streptomyces sp. NPDC057554 TaxID=3350538 RepID=UPI0036BCB0DB